jgi:predicted transcriptional regulator
MNIKLSIFGSSEIINHHIKAAKKNSFQIFSICTSNKHSKNVIKISKKNQIHKVFYNWKSFIKNSKDNDCNVLICGRIKDNEKILDECLKNNLKVFIEKPVFTKVEMFNKYLKFKDKIFIGYNRVYYKNVLELKKIILEGELLNISVKCPEINKKNILTNSCHIFSILHYLFGRIKIVKKIKNKDFIICFLKTKKNIPILINFNFNAPDNFSIEINLKNKRVELRPIEKLYIFDKIVKRKYKQNNIIIPNLKKVSNEFKMSNLKPGFELQYKNFKRFLKNLSYEGIKINDAKEIISICQKIAS